MSDKKQKVKFKDRKSVKFLKEKAPDILGNSLDFIGDVTGIESLEKLGEKISGLNDEKVLTPEQQEYALKLIEIEIEQEKQITERWISDNESGAKLSKVVRPITLLIFACCFILISIFDSIETVKFDLKQAYILVYENILIIIVIAYYGSRGFEKYSEMKRKRN